MQTLSQNISIVSVLNPNMRVFDVVMHTEFGTSYNSYVVHGKEKIAIIDANHARFADEWLEKVQNALAGREPDYLVLNHTEPDHSGSVLACLEHYPQIKIVCSSAGAVNLRNITNLDALDPLVVKTGDSLDLGGLSLEFRSAPFLHWPDTMFTWLPEEKVAFTCDFLGAHYCEPRLYDHRIIYRRNYTHAFREYYEAIMAPFVPWVQKGLDILDTLDPEIVATSHGPILTKGDELLRNIERYREWSATGASSKVNESQEQSGKAGVSSSRLLKIPLFYCSAYGNTKTLAEHIATGIRKALPDAQVVAHDLVDADLAAMRAELNGSDAFLIGSPTINKDALPLVWQLLAGIDAINIAKRPVALFGSYGWSGEAVPALTERLAFLKVNVYEEQFLVKFVPSEQDLKDAEEFGTRFGQFVGS